MKQVLVFAVFALLVYGCEKPNTTPEGPTDVRIKNLTDQTFTNVVVDTGSDDGEHNYGIIEAGAVSDYFRYTKAYPDAEINVLIGGVAYSTGIPDNTYATYIGPDKITYEVYISNPELKKLSVDVVLDGAIDD